RRPLRQSLVVPGASPRDPFSPSLHRDRPLRRVSRHVHYAKWARRKRVGADLVGTETERVSAVGLVEVRFLWQQPVAVRITPIVGAAGGTLPLVFITKA